MLQLLFIGDSTNRGMMHYIMQQLDGSLAACDKTHHIRVYSTLNHGHTTLSFAYYPQFWLAAPERPVFDKTLYQLLLKQVYGLQVPVVLYECVTWSLAAKREHKRRVFENRVLSSVFGPKREDESGENYIMRSLMICATHQISFG